jgi:uncharacterized protein (DUF3084 family)
MDLPNFITKALGFQTAVEQKLDSLTQAQTDLAEARQKLTQAESDLATARQTLSTVTAERDQARTDLTSAQAEVTTLKSQNAELQAKVDKIPAQVAARANQIAVKQGVPPVKEEEAADPRTGTASLLDQVNAIADPVQRAKFIREHRSELAAAR